MYVITFKDHFTVERELFGQDLSVLFELLVLLPVSDVQSVEQLQCMHHCQSFFHQCLIDIDDLASLCWFAMTVTD